MHQCERELDLDALENAAQAATQGDWGLSGVRSKLDGMSVHNIYAGEKQDIIASVFFDTRTGIGFSDAKFIGAASPATALRLIALARQAASAGRSAGWRDMATAPRDGSPVLCQFHADIYPRIRPGRDDLEPWNGLCAVMHHRGNAPDGWDPGWVVSAPVGHGGFPDEWFLGWRPLPSSEAPTPGDNCGANADGRS